MLSRVSLIQLYLLARGDNTLWEEQPGDSVMFYHPRKVLLKRLLQTGILPGSYHCVHTWLGAFWAPTAKSTRIWGNTSQIHSSKRTLTRWEITYLGSLSRTYTTDELRAAAGLSSVTGVSSELQKTQK